MGRKPKEDDQQDVRSTEDMTVQQRRTQLRMSLAAELHTLDSENVTDRKLASRFLASNASLPQRMRVERMTGNRGQLVIEPPSERQQAATIKMAQFLSEGEKHPLLNQLRTAFLSSVETFAVLELAEDLFLPEVEGLSALYGDFSRRKDQLSEKIVRQELAKPPVNTVPGLSAEL